MSAYVVQDKTINAILGFLWQQRSDSWYQRKVKQEVERDVLVESDLKALGVEMFRLNCDAVNQRYGDGEAAQFRPLDYVPAMSFTGRMQVYKSLRCWLYQCTEGTVPETVLYKLMARIADELAHEIISYLPEYERSLWD